MKMGMFLGLILWIVVAVSINAAFAHGHDHDDHDINIDIDVNHNDGGGTNSVDTSGCLCVTNGVSDKDLGAALAMGSAAGSHQFDFSTQDNQMSITYAIQIDAEEEQAYSIAYARRWDRLGQALFHISYTPEQSSNGDIVVFGGTIRF